MFDVGWSEIVLIGAVALIVIGPKELPKALRTLGQMTTKVKRMASEFQGQFNDAMREAELDQIKKEVADINASARDAANVDFNPIQTIRDDIMSAVEGRKSVDDPFGPHPAVAMQPDPIAAIEPTLPAPLDAPVIIDNPTLVADEKPKRVRKPKAASPKASASDEGESA